MLPTPLRSAWALNLGKTGVQPGQPEYKRLLAEGSLGPGGNNLPRQEPLSPGVSTNF